MQHDDNKPLCAFGFLTAIEHTQHGFFGGYLIVSTLGRPLEFHCTTPVLPNPAQKILYGQSLRPYLLGELIGRTLLQKAKTPVCAVLTDQPELLSQSAHVDCPIACVRVDGEVNATEASKLQIGRYRLSVADQGINESTLRELLEPLTVHVDLPEPFQRIRDAIHEAQRMSEPTEDQDDESAAAA